MKNITFIFVCLINSIFARSESSSMMVTCRQISMAIGAHLEMNNRILPSSLDELVELDLMVKDNLIIRDRINRLAVVPGAPTIYPEFGISSEYTKRKLFAIYRVPNFDNTLPKDEKNNLGRYAIFINQEAMPDPPRWIPESEAQLILKQLKDFDPAKQPLAFQDVDITQLDKSNLSLDISAIPVSPNSSKPRTDIRAAQAPSSTPTTMPLWPWLLGVLLTILVITGWRFLKKRL